MAKKKTSEKRDRMGRPPKPLPKGLEVARPYLRLSDDHWKALRLKAKQARRSVSGEVEVALAAYIAANPTLPAAGDVDPGHVRERMRLSSGLVRRLDARAGVDDRERQLVAAVTWWLNG